MNVRTDLLNAVINSYNDDVWLKEYGFIKCMELIGELSGGGASVLPNSIPIYVNMLQKRLSDSEKKHMNFIVKEKEDRFPKMPLQEIINKFMVNHPDAFFKEIAIGFSL